VMHVEQVRTAVVAHRQEGLLRAQAA
jgi:hypothetical protein